MAHQSQAQRDTLFVAGWMLLLVVAGLMTLNHLLLTFILDQPDLFVGYTFFNLFALAVLLLPFRRREQWAWLASWLLPLGLAIPALINAEIRVFYLVAASLAAVGMVLTAHAFRAQNRLASSPVAALGLALVLAATALAGCGPIQPSAAAPATAPAAAGDAATEAAALPELTITFTTDGIQVPAEVPAGPTVVNLVYEGAAPVQGGPTLPPVGQLAEGATVEQLLAVLPNVMQNPAETLALLKFYGVAIAPTARTIWNLEPGAHVALSVLDAPMVQSFTVTEAASPAEAPTADVQVQLVDFAVTMPDTVAAGPQLWEIENAGQQWHEIAIITLADGLTVEDLLPMMAGPEPEAGAEAGPPVFELIWGYVALAEGKRVLAEVDLPPGEYTVICFLPDLLGDMAPHAAHGMVRSLTVQ